MWRYTDTSLLPVPTHDLLVRQSALAALRRDRGTPDDLERALEPLYPDVDVRVQNELAAMRGDPAWYVYRDGSFMPTNPRRARQLEPGRAVLDDAGRLVDADDAVVGLLGADRPTLRGMFYAAFVAPEVVELVDGLIGLLDDAGSLESRWLLRTLAGHTALVNVGLLRSGAEAHRHLVSIQQVM